MTDPRPPRRPLPRRTVMIRIAVGLSVAAAAAVTLTPVANALPHAFGGGSASAAPAPLVGGNSKSAIAGEYVVMLKDPAGLQAAGVEGSGESSQSLVAAAVQRGKDAGATVQEQYTELRGYSAKLSGAELDKIRKDPTVQYVAVNQRYRSTGTETDPDWGLDRIDQRSDKLNGSYFYTNTGTGVTAYVVDTGVRSTHRDFTTDLAGAQVGSRVSGGISEVNDDNGTEDCQGHGTHVAGTIGGTVYGVAKEVSLVPIRVLDCKGVSSSSIVAKGLDWIVAHHTKGKPAVANMSLTNEGGADPVVEAAVERVIADGVTVVIAAGNGNAAGVGIPACTVSPSDVKDAIVVGATTRTDRKTGFSNYGGCVDVYAPGLGIKSDWATADTATATLDGTSMATPHVTGAAVLYLQKHPTATPAQVQSALVAAATPNVVTKVSTKWPHALLFATQKVKAPAATATKTTITSGTALLAGKSICSTNGLYCLTQTTKDLTLSKPGARVLWHNGKAAAWTTMTSTGNLVSYNAYGQKVWSSGTSGGAATLRVTNLGNLQILSTSTGKATWTSNKAQETAPVQIAKGRATMNTGSALYRAGHTLVSKNGTYSLALRANGNLTVTKKGAGIVWSTGVKNADWLTVTSTGNLALVNADGSTVWTSKTAGKGANRVRLQSTGKLELVKTSTDKVIWTAK